ncbi:hypothetical protein Halru_2991 [Halovivax ruber XH-70]|uniref:Uncharacterized protein n=1 Tax=Halovivax ruber (strain DSM 18193 / JCM 13892 / XH-70) TaxID=797302 RepID=L0IFE1_HALRX|nr:hypothetical protein [Halovivax ruber]AGB17558.1 hypothetical protein Halru_2991 [Halovivax ruber XH-70]
MTDRDSTRPPGTDSDDSPSSGTDERRPARDDPPATDTDQSAGDDGSANQDADGDVKRRTYLQAIGAAGAAGAIGAGAGLSGLGAQTVNAQADPNGTVLATFCGTFSGGPQVQQCIACVEAACPEDEVNPLYPLFTGLTGSCFTPASIPDGAEWVTLKAGQNCYLAPVEDNTTFCLPPGAPDISNATFYTCDGDDPQPAVIDYTVTCEEIVVTTDNIDDGTTLTAEVTFLDGEGTESTVTFQATVQDDTATFDLPGNLNPTNLVLLLDDLVLDDQPVVAEDAPCTPEPPVFDGVDVTCDAITVSTTNVPEGGVLSITVSFTNGLVETYNVPVDADGVAVVPLPGDVDPSYLTVVYDGETLFDMEVQATDAPCAEPTPPEPPEPPEPKPPKKEIRKKMMRHKRKYEMYKKMLEKSD